MEFHPVSKIFPLMTDSEIELLAEDIKENGQHEPIWLDSEGRIIDGRNRYYACKSVDVEPITESWSESEHGELFSFALSKNLHRRQLSNAQRAIIAARIADYKPGNRDTQICASLTQEQAAKITCVGKRSLQSARKVIDDGVPELTNLVESGQLSVSAAEAISGLPENEQKDILAQGPKEVRAAAGRIKSGKKDEDLAAPCDEPKRDESEAPLVVGPGRSAETVTTTTPDIDDPGTDIQQSSCSSKSKAEVSCGICAIIVAEPPWREMGVTSHRDHNSNVPTLLDPPTVKKLLAGFVEQQAHEDAAILLRSRPYYLSDARAILAQLDFDHLLDIPVSIHVTEIGNGVGEGDRDYVLLGLRGDMAGLDFLGLARWLDDRRLKKEGKQFSIQGLAHQLSNGPITEVCWSATTEEACCGK